jgi:TPR repeat protein
MRAQISTYDALVRPVIRPLVRSALFCGVLLWTSIATAQTAQSAPTLECALGQADYPSASIKLADLTSELARLQISADSDSSARKKAAGELKADLALSAVEGALRWEAIGDFERAKTYWDFLSAKFAAQSSMLEARAKRGNERALWLSEEWTHRRAKRERWEGRACDRLLKASLDDGGLYFRKAVCLQARDPQAALKSMERSADLGHPAAMEILGMMCANEGLDEANARACAVRWLCSAAGLGRKSAASMAAYALTEGKPSAAVAVKAAALYEMAASLKDPSAANNLGEVYERGWIGRVDLVAAKKWYGMSAEWGLAYGKLNLARLLWKEDRPRAMALIEAARVELPRECELLLQTLNP